MRESLSRAMRETWHVCMLSVAHWHSVEMAIDIIFSKSNLFTTRWPHYSSFPYQKVWQYSDGDPDKMQMGQEKITVSRSTSEIIQDRFIITMEGVYETIPKLSNGTSFNDLE